MKKAKHPVILGVIYHRQIHLECTSKWEAQEFPQNSPVPNFMTNHSSEYFRDVSCAVRNYVNVNVNVNVTVMKKVTRICRRLRLRLLIPDAETGLEEEAEEELLECHVVLICAFSAGTPTQSTLKWTDLLMGA
jgi:hypothetical protein